MHKKKIVASMSIAVALMAQMAAAHSAGLGKLSVESALGQPLKAKIDVIATDPAELSNLHARLASPDAFRKANLELNSTITHIKFALDKKADGGLVLKLTSDTPVNDPYIDMLVELDWGNGKMLREYTILLDPPDMKTAGGGTNSGNLIVSPAVTAGTGSNGVSSVPGQSTPVAKTRRQTQSENGTATPPAKAVAANRASESESATGPQTIGPIKRGENLSEIAERTKPEGVHLEQMLVGLYRHNEKAFDGNMNRLKTGQILTVPSKSEIASISEKEAVQEVQLQAADWHSYRQKLAGEVAAAPSAAEKPSQAGGKITSAVEDKAALPRTGQDVLKLSKGEIPANSNKLAGGKSAAANAAMQKQMAQDDAEARQKALAEARDRAAALEKNNQAMQKLLALKNQSLAEAQKNQVKPVPPVAAKPPVVPAKPAAKPTTVTPPPGNWYDALNPLYVGAGAVILLLLALFGFMNKSRNRRQGLSKFENSILTNVDHKPNTVYGAQGGASVNTSNNTSFLTDFSQSGLGTLDTHEVDPIAEAEVYMAYGRDEQAEEILKEAMAKDPARHEIKLKLLEIYAARNNLPAFESIATELYAALNGENTPVWEKAAELGRKLDPKNPLYGGAASINPLPAHVLQPEESPVAEPDTNPETIEIPEAHDYGATMAEEHYEMPAAPAMDFPMAMDFDLEMTPVNSAGADTTLHGRNETGDTDDFAGHAVDADDMPKAADTEGMEFTSMREDAIPEYFAGNSEQDMSERDEPATPAVETPSVPVAGEDAGYDEHKLSFDFDFEDSHALPPTDAENLEPPATAFEPEEGPITLDFSGIDLNLDSPAAEETVMSEAEQEVKTKFELAQVYQEMGDHENAREILQEVIAEGNPQQQASAQELLQKLG
ncbi:MAG TPA: FimV/HubP family polar landmark protein [Burkholderiales bacterium]|nr:FimV/HubP family polar landmark protein [Burkholderiales bacterium]